MARIRTIKPDFFTSDDICVLSPLARLLYIGLWCEADREGRLAWTPRVFKRRYLPDDDCDIEAICLELLKRDLVRLYGDDLAYIPTFLEHQHINPREARSNLPEPPDEITPRRVDDASRRVSDAQVGKEGRKEGEGKEGEGRRAPHASLLPDDWEPSAEDLAVVAKTRPDLTPALIAEQTQRFRNHATEKARTSHSWGMAWRNWMGDAKVPLPPKGSRADAATIVADHNSDSQWLARVRGWKPGKFWNRGDWGPPPGEAGCRVPVPILSQMKSEVLQ
jgi:hypothetical protein